LAIDALGICDTCFHLHEGEILTFGGGTIARITNSAGIQIMARVGRVHRPAQRVGTQQVVGVTKCTGTGSVHRVPANRATGLGGVLTSRSLADIRKRNREADEIGRHHARCEFCGGYVFAQQACCVFGALRVSGQDEGLVGLQFVDERFKGAYHVTVGEV